MNPSSRLFTTLVLSTSLLACQSNEKKRDADAAPAEEVMTDTTLEVCFRQVTQGTPQPGSAQRMADTLSVQLTFSSDSVTGFYAWLPSQKDKLTGTLAGTMRDSVITAVLTYAAEGTTGREEKIFKLDGTRLLMKSGEMVDKNGIMVLKDPASLAFSQSIPKVACP